MKIFTILPACASPICISRGMQCSQPLLYGTIYDINGFCFNWMCILCKQYGQEHKESKSCNSPKFSERFRPGYFSQQNWSKTALFHALRGRVCASQSSWNLTLATIDSYYMLTVYYVKIKSQFSYITVLGDVPQNHFLKDTILLKRRTLYHQENMH